MGVGFRVVDGGHESLAVVEVDLYLADELVGGGVEAVAVHECEDGMEGRHGGVGGVLVGAVEEDESVAGGQWLCVVAAAAGGVASRDGVVDVMDGDVAEGGVHLVFSAGPAEVAGLSGSYLGDVHEVEFEGAFHGVAVFLHHGGLEPLDVGAFEGASFEGDVEGQVERVPAAVLLQGAALEDDVVDFSVGFLDGLAVFGVGGEVECGCGVQVFVEVVLRQGGCVVCGLSCGDGLVEGLCVEAYRPVRVVLD